MHLRLITVWLMMQAITGPSSSTLGPKMCCWTTGPEDDSEPSDGSFEDAQESQDPPASDPEPTLESQLASPSSKNVYPLGRLVTNFSSIPPGTSWRDYYWSGDRSNIDGNKRSLSPVLSQTRTLAPRVGDCESSGLSLTAALAHTTSTASLAGILRQLAQS